ncbi:unnamed protein product [Miscanthus lutarioriparius]|uniref:Secreted protein n=1 Tax=Miscanthus lutarioriparius TaxID=422564 RepID=A0A811RFY5_9POAL|nr:unnamed protein product [Miscanthus lutarioriparius]
MELSAARVTLLLRLLCGGGVVAVRDCESTTTTFPVRAAANQLAADDDCTTHSRGAFSFATEAVACSGAAVRCSRLCWPQTLAAADKQGTRSLSKLIRGAGGGGGGGGGEPTSIANARRGEEPAGAGTASISTVPVVPPEAVMPVAPP